jgi:sugar lactone lactonase YvrE
LPALALASHPAAHAQANFGASTVGASVTASVTVTATQAGQVASVQVLTLGQPNLDFTDAGGNCASSNLTAGQQCSETIRFTPAYPGQRMGAVVLFDSGSNVLGTAALQGSGSGGLGVLLPGTAQTYAGDGDWKSEGDDEAAISTELFLPSAVALDGSGNLYIADSHHGRIRVVCSGTTPALGGITCRQKGFIYTVANTQGNLGYAGDGLVATNGSVALNTPSGLAIDGAGNLYIADTGNNVIRKIAASTNIITTIAGTGTKGFGGDGAAATAAQLDQPDGVAVDAQGNVFIADTGNGRIRAICAAAGSSIFGVSCPAIGDIVTIAGGGSALGDAGQATAASLDTPYTIGFDANSNLYIADSNNQRIRSVCAAANNMIFGQRCTAAGIINTVAGNGTKGYSGDGGAATSASVNSPSGLVLDAAGNLYIADTENFLIRKVNASSGKITTVAGNSSGGFGGDNGPATQAGIYGPYGLALDASGNLYVAEFLDNRVRLIQDNLSQLTVKSPVRQGSTSAPVSITVENDGSAALTLTGIQLGTNTAFDAATTTCAVNGSLTVDQQCTVGAEFAPAASPTLSSNQTESGSIQIPDQTVSGVAGSNSPLVIQVTGTATPVNATTVVLTSAPNPSTFGQSVTFSVAVTTGANTGSLTGNVTFFDGATQLGSAVTVNSGGKASLAVSSLTVGQHQITAKYNGDSMHFASTSDPLAQTVNEATATTLSSSANPSALNTSMTLTAVVKPSAGGGVTPDGTVTFMDGANALATVTIDASGTAALSISTLADGMHSIAAVYSGDTANFLLGSTSNTVSQDVIAASNVTIVSSLNPSSYGAQVTFSAAVSSSASAVPTGVVNFMDGGTQIGSATLIGTTAQTTFSTSALTAGTHAITAVYKGDSSNGPGSSVAANQVVNPAPTTTAISAAPSPGIAGGSETLTAKVDLTSGSGAVSGTVTFMDGSAILGTATVDATGLASIKVSLAPGTHSLVANYGGDGNDNVSASAQLPFTVVLATTSVSLTSSGTPLQALSNATFTATVSGNGGIPTGNVVFTVDGTASATVALASGVAKFSTSTLTVGTHTVMAAYSGDTNDNPGSSTSLSEVIQPIPTVTNLGVSATQGPTPVTILVATALASTGPAPTGTVTFSTDSKVIGSATVDATGVATLAPDLPPGSYNVVASYSGDAIHSASTSQAVTISSQAIGFAVNVNPPNLTLKTSQNGTVTVSFTSEEGFADSIGMGCLSLPAGVNCHFGNSAVALKSGGTQTVELTIDTNAPLSGGTPVSDARKGRGGVSLASLFLPVSLLFGWMLWRVRRRNPALMLGALLLWVSGAFAITGCGAGFTQNTVAPGTYNIQVGGVGTQSNISHYVNVTLNVTK